MKINIGIITKSVDQKTSGSGWHVKNIVENILKLNNNYKIYLIHYHTNIDEPIYKEADITEVIVPRNPILASRILSKLDLKIVHYTSLSILSPIYWIKSKKVATIHGCSSYYLPHQFSLITRLHEKYIRPFLVNKMDYVFTVSNASKKLIQYHDRYSPEKIVLTYNAVDSEFTPANEKENSKFVDNQFIPFILHVSKYSERKNPLIILNAFKKFNQRNKDYRLLIAGSGWDNTRVKAFIHDNALIDNIELLGYVDKKRLIALLQNAEVFIFPSLYEGFGIPNLEAMACGCPVVTSHSGAIPEIVGASALLLTDKNSSTELEQKISSITNDKDLRKELIRKGLRTAKKYNWKDSAVKILSTYDSCTIIN
jgi:glycosyltransferase involved in cell wall biosynthesis